MIKESYVIRSRASSCDSTRCDSATALMLFSSICSEAILLKTHKGSRRYASNKI
jgi:hypothetical protein